MQKFTQIIYQSTLMSSTNIPNIPNIFKFASKYLSNGVWHDYVRKKSLSGQIWAKLCLTNYAEIHLDYARLSLNNIIH